MAKNIFHNSTFIIIVKSEQRTRKKKKYTVKEIDFLDETLTSFLFVLEKSVGICEEAVEGNFLFFNLSIYIPRTFLRIHKP